MEPGFQQPPSVEAGPRGGGWAGPLVGTRLVGAGACPEHLEEPQEVYAGVGVGG